jgi:hypothetical protein
MNLLKEANNAFRLAQYNRSVALYLEHFCANFTFLSYIRINVQWALKKKHLELTDSNSGYPVVFLDSEMELERFNRITNSYFKKNNLSFNNSLIINIEQERDVSDHNNHLKTDDLILDGMKTIQFTEADTFISETISYVIDNPTNELALLSYSEPAIFILLIYSIVYSPKIFVPSSDGRSLVESNFFNPIGDSQAFDLLKKNMQRLTCLKKLFLLNFLLNSKAYCVDRGLQKNLSRPLRYKKSFFLNRNLNVPSDYDLSKYIVYFEEYKNGVLSGWVCNPSIGHNPEIDVKINDQIVVKNFKKWNSRDDVSKHHGIPEGHFGFGIPYCHNKVNQILTISVCLAGSNKALGGGSFLISSDFLHILFLLEKVKEQREEKDFIGLAKTNNKIATLRKSIDIFRLNQKLITVE